MLLYGGSCGSVTPVGAGVWAVSYQDRHTKSREPPKKLVATASRRDGRRRLWSRRNRTRAERGFHERRGTTAWGRSDFHKKIGASDTKLVPTYQVSIKRYFFNFSGWSWAFTLNKTSMKNELDYLNKQPFGNGIKLEPLVQNVKFFRF